MLYALAYAMLVALVPLSEHAHLEARAVTAARYAAVADDIATVVEGAGEPRIEGSAELEALVLAALASFEGRVTARVDSCHVGGPAWSLWQVKAPRALVCADRQVAVRWALFRVRESWALSGALPLEERLAWYASGALTARARAASRRRLGAPIRWWSTHD